ncbi:MAG TPA: hypothetical protein VMV00_00250 [Candidatus Baltobacteraceae bacterium]|nr:hypothetical protein [Candidatus Baltobacteraceae bacterium]
MLTANNIRISLDRREPSADIDFVSHAHTDHIAAVKSSKSIVASEQTVQLVEELLDRKLNTREVPDSVRLLSAGHMLGSKQLCVDDSETGKRIVYTGDFQLAPSRTADKIEIVDTDTLIVDSTYCSPNIKFDKKEDVEWAMQKWTRDRVARGIAIFSVYAMGKAQEMIAILNDAGITPVVSGKIAKISGVYVRNGVKLDYLSKEDRPEECAEALKGDFVGITERRDLVQYGAELSKTHQTRVFTGVATGWSQAFRFDTDVQFGLSDHADFAQCVDYINASGAKEVLTYGSNSDEFAQNLTSAGYNAHAFGDAQAPL